MQLEQQKIYEELFDNLQTILSEYKVDIHVFKIQNQKQEINKILQIEDLEKQIAQQIKQANKYKDAFKETWLQKEEMYQKFWNLYDKNQTNLEQLRKASLNLEDFKQKSYDQMNSLKALNAKLQSEDITSNCLFEVKELIQVVIKETEFLLNRTDNVSLQQEDNIETLSQINQEKQFVAKAYQFCSKCEDLIRSFQNEMESKLQKIQSQLQFENKQLKQQLYKQQVNFHFIKSKKILGFKVICYNKMDLHIQYIKSQTTIIEQITKYNKHE